jgi:hypothetical protein
MFVNMDSARKCIAQRKDGQPCRAWARRGSDPPYCVVHRPDTVAERGSGSAGEQVAEGHVAGGHVVVAGEIDGASGEEAGFYDQAYSMQEIADLMRAAVEGDLRDEMTAARIAVRRVLQQLEQELSPAEYARMAGLIFQGTSTIARLAQAQRDLSKEAAEEWAKAIARALDEVGRERGVKL